MRSLSADNLNYDFLFEIHLNETKNFIEMNSISTKDYFIKN